MPRPSSSWIARRVGLGIIVFACHCGTAPAQDIADCTTIGYDYDKNGIFHYDPAYAPSGADAELEADIRKSDRQLAYEDIWQGSDPEILVKAWPGVGLQLFHSMLLTSAVANNDLGHLRELLHAGADPNLDAPDGIMTPLITAARCASPEITVVLLRSGARVNETSYHTDGSEGLITGTTALTFAADRGNLSIVQSLLRAGADPNAQETYTDIATNHSERTGTPLLEGPPLPALLALLHAGAKLDFPTATGKTPLMAEAEKGNADACYFLLQLGVDKRRKDVNGETAAKYAQDWGYTALAKAISHWTAETPKSAWPRNGQ